MFNSTVGEVWCKLLFNAMSIPFAILLTVLIASQVMMVKGNAEADALKAPSEMAGDVLF